MRRSIIAFLLVLGLLLGAAPAFAQSYWYYINGNLFSVAPITVNGGVNISGGTKTTTTQPVLNLTDTWVEGSTTFAGIKYVITDTASASGSLPFQILGGAAGTTNLFSVNKSGAINATNIYATSNFGFSSYGTIAPISSGVWTFRNNEITGFTTLNLGPVTGNTANGTLQLDKVSTVINMATATGTGTGTITSPTTALPAATLIKGISCRVSPALAGAGLTTFSLGDGVDADRWGTGLAITLDTLVNIGNYTVTGPAYQIAAGSIVLTAAAGVFSTGILTCTTYLERFINIGS